MIEFFNRPLTEVRVEKIEEEGLQIGDDQTPALKVKTTRKTTGCDFPTFLRFGLSIGVSDQTLENWAKEHPEFLSATEVCRKMQEDIIKINSFNGHYSQSFAQFLLKNNHGYRDKTEVEQTVAVVQMPAIKLQDGRSLDFDVGDDVED